MTQEELKKYVQDQLMQGIDPQVLRMALESEGLSKEEIYQALSGKTYSPAVQIPNTSASTPGAASGTPQPIMPASSISVKSGFAKFFAHKTAIVTILILLVLVAGGAYAYTTYMVTPEKAREKMLANLADIKSVEYEGTINAELTTSSLNSLTGEDDSSGPNTYKGEISFSGLSDTSTENSRSKFQFKVTAEGFLFDIEALAIDRVSYFKINQFPALGFFDEGAIKNQWIKLDSSSQNEAGNEENPIQNITPEQTAKINEALAKYPAITLTDKLGSEKIGDTNTWHYKFRVDEKNLNDLVLEILRIVAPERLSEDETVVREGLNKAFAAVNIPDGEVWIGKNDYLPRKMNVSMTIVAPDKQSSAKVNLSVIYKSFNLPVNIEVPTDALDVNDIFNGFTAPALDSEAFSI